MGISRLTFFRVELIFTGFVLAVGLWVCPGCGGDASSPAGHADGSAGTGQTGSEKPAKADKEEADVPSLPTASISGSNESGNSDGSSEPAEGSAEWLVRESTLLRLQPLPETDDLQKRRAARQERNATIVELATEAIKLTHNQPDKEQVFNAAVHYLMEARLQQALQGDEEAIDSLYNDAASLYHRDPESKAATEAAYTLAQLAFRNAQRFAEQEPRWLEEFSRQARMFANNFPQDQARAAGLLFNAARSCELHDMTQEATACYAALKKKFPESPQGKQAGAILRRLDLTGKPLELAGPTIEGGYLSIDDYRGKVVLVVFWSTHAQPFLDALPALKEATANLPKEQFDVITVNLDEEETAVDAFLEQHAMPWPQVFFADRQQRGWNNPVANYYGVRDVPTFWLVAPNGRVVDTAVKPEELQSQVQSLLDGTST